jgi:hypothetical protein
MGEQVVYVYGIVPSGADVTNAPSGLDDARVLLEREGEIAALVSMLDGAIYESDAVQRQSADVDWVAPRAVAHDAVLSWASDAGAVLPLPMFTLFSSARGVHAMLCDRAAELRLAIAHVAPAQEFGVRVFRIDADLQRHIGALSPAIAQIERDAAQATPGQRYLLERKADDTRASEVRRVAAEVAHEVYHVLTERALDGAADALPTQDGARVNGTAVLNAFFLERRDRLESFRAALTALAKRYEALGFRFDFTGPWPPYHFAGPRT